MNVWHCILKRRMTELVKSSIQKKVHFIFIFSSLVSYAVAFGVLSKFRVIFSSVDFVQNEQLFSIIMEVQNMSVRAKHVFAIFNELSDTCQQKKKEKSSLLLWQCYFCKDICFLKFSSEQNTNVSFSAGQCTSKSKIGVKFNFTLRVKRCNDIVDKFL